MSEHEQDPNAPEPQQDDRQWIPVPPPNPYAAASRPPGGRALAIAAMVLGLVALLTVAVAAAYFTPLAVLLGAAAGIAAIVLGIVALVRRSRPKAAGVVGLAAGALSLLSAVVILALASFALVATTMESQQRGGGDSEWSDDAEPEAMLEWPANMETGGIVFERGEGGEGSAPAVRLSDPVGAGGAPVPLDVDRSGGVADVVVYLDYRCPYCLHFEEANGALLGELASSGAATVQLVPLTFLDRVDSTSYSSRAAGAMACVVDGQPEAAWAAHNALLSAEVQPSESVPGLSNDELIAALDAAAGGLDPGVRECVGSERFVPFAQALNDWVFANSVPNAVEPAQRVTGTPMALVNGVVYTGAPDDAAAFRQFIDEQSR